MGPERPDSVGAEKVEQGQGKIAHNAKEQQQAKDEPERLLRQKRGHAVPAMAQKAVQQRQQIQKYQRQQQRRHGIGGQRAGKIQMQQSVCRPRGAAAGAVQPGQKEKQAGHHYYSVMDTEKPYTEYVNK